MQLCTLCNYNVNIIFCAHSCFHLFFIVNFGSQIQRHELILNFLLLKSLFWSNYFLKFIYERTSNLNTAACHHFNSHQWRNNGSKGSLAFFFNKFILFFISAYLFPHFWSLVLKNKNYFETIMQKSVPHIFMVKPFFYWLLKDSKMWLVNFKRD